MIKERRELGNGPVILIMESGREFLVPPTPPHPAPDSLYEAIAQMIFRKREEAKRDLSVSTDGVPDVRPRNASA